MEENGQIVEYLADCIHEEDKRVLAIEQSPSSADQQVLEALALLVALRHWMPEWKNRRVQIAVRTDNVAALTMVCKMQPHSDRVGVVARELALDIAESSCAPEEEIHIPGIANKAADALSRLHQPGKTPPLPDYLKPDMRVACSPRPRRLWKSLPTT